MSLVIYSIFWCGVFFKTQLGSTDKTNITTSDHPTIHPLSIQLIPLRAVGFLEPVPAAMSQPALVAIFSLNILLILKNTNYGVILDTACKIPVDIANLKLARV